MTSNASLEIGVHKPKNNPGEFSASTSLAFSSTLSSLLSTSSSRAPSQGRPRPRKTKNDIFTSHNKNAWKRAARDLEGDNGGESDKRQKVGRQDIGGVDEGVLDRSRKKLEAKAKIYRAMKRGEVAEGEVEGALVDFDRKWAQGEDDEEEDSADEDAGADEEVEFEDEYGRTKRGTRAEAERMERKKRNALLVSEELGRMSARPAMPEKVIYGDAVQVLAFNPDEEQAIKMEELARKRDRSPTPPEAKHYEADKEIRIKGVGFYAFSKDEGLREQEMANLEAERVQTERVRREREEKKANRLREIEERRRAIGEKRARKQADSFLEGLGEEMGGG